MHTHHERLFVVAAVENADAPALRQRLHAAPEIIVIKIFGARRLEGRHLAPLRIHPRHDVFDGAILARCIHRLENEQHRPAVLCVKNVLQLREGLHTGLQRLLRPRLVFGRELSGITGIYVREAEFLAVRYAVRF
jgi:hypothetical protein